MSRITKSSRADFDKNIQRKLEVIGLKNKHYFCYINAALQLLFTIPALTKKFNLIYIKTHSFEWVYFWWAIQDSNL